ncbi:MAG TPA: alpha/beta fold hydrolase [Pirellulales bacterium]
MKRIILLALLPLVALSASVAWSMTEEERKEYRDKLLQILPPVDSFQKWVDKTGALPPDFDSLPRCNSLPDPFTFQNGSRVKDAADWKARRAEIMELEEKYDFGKFPPKPKLENVVVIGETAGKGYITRNVRLEYGPDKKATMRVQVTIPDGKDPMPVLISPSLAGWATSLVRRGYISAGYAASDFSDDTDSLVGLYPDYDFAKLPRRAWAAQMVIDYLVSLPQVNPKQIAITGYSRDGKMAAIAAALDERIAAVIPGSTGVGGVLPWRSAGERGFGESIESTTRSFPDWFAPQLRWFAGREDRLPVDGNLIVAMIAPRACLIEYGENDQVSHPWGMEQSYYSAKKVYGLLGKPDALNILHVPGFHGANDQEACIDWLDIQFGRSNRKWENHLQFAWDLDQWKRHAGEALDLKKFSQHKPDDLLAGVNNAPIVTKEAWETKAAEIQKAVQLVLGEEPPMMPALGRGGFPGRGAPGRGRPGAEVRGTPGAAAPSGTTAQAATSAADVARAANPGQTKPDLVKWVISNGGNSYGWLKAQADQTASRPINFGYGVKGDLYYPADVKDGTKLPTVIWLHGYSYPLGYMWVYHNELHPVLALVKAGYAVLAFDQTGFGSRMNEAGPFYDRYPHWSEMGRMVEDTRSAIDALQKDSLVDPDKIYLFGYSLGGMVALHTAVLEPRVKGVVSLCGFTPMRTDAAGHGTGGIARYTREHPLLPKLDQFIGQEDRIPYDYDELIAAIAPRPVYVFQPKLDRDAVPADVEQGVAQAKKVFGLYGADEKLVLDEPWDYNRLPAASQERIIKWMTDNLK